MFDTVYGAVEGRSSPVWVETDQRTNRVPNSANGAFGGEDIPHDSMFGSVKQVINNQINCVIASKYWERSASTNQHSSAPLWNSNIESRYDPPMPQHLTNLEHCCTQNIPVVAESSLVGDRLPSRSLNKVGTSTAPQGIVPQ